MLFVAAAADVAVDVIAIAATVVDVHNIAAAVVAVHSIAAAVAHSIVDSMPVAVDIAHEDNSEVAHKPRNIMHTKGE